MVTALLIALAAATAAGWLAHARSLRRRLVDAQQARCHAEQSRDQARSDTDRAERTVQAARRAFAARDVALEGIAHDLRTSGLLILADRVEQLLARTPTGDPS